MSQNLPTRKDIIQAILTNPKLSEEEKSILVEEFINEIKREYPDLKYHATKQDVSETELKLTKEIKEIEANLTKEIENTRKEIKELELKLTKEIENVRKEIKDLDLKLTKEIENVRKEIKDLDLKLTKEIKELDARLTSEIKESKVTMIKWSFIFWISQISVIMGMGFFIYKVLMLKG